MRKKPENLYNKHFLPQHGKNFEYQWKANITGERKDADINPMVLKKGWKLYNNNNFIRSYTLHDV